MLAISFRLNRHRAAALSVAVIAVAAAALSVLPGWRKNTVPGATDAERRGYIESLGYTPSSDTAETDTVLIPDEFSDVYTEYNKLQTEAGFDLSKYRGRSVERYSYHITDYTDEQAVSANLLVLNGVIIGGDVSSRRLDGFMLPLTEKNGG